MTDFESQFNEKKIVHIQGKKVSFVDIVPSAPVSDVPIFIAPGWGETPRTFKDLLNMLYRKGFRVLSVYHPRQDLKLITKKSVSRVESQKAEIILTILDAQRIRKANVIAHSEGAINAVIAAYLRPSAFKRLILVGPGGLVDREPFFELVSRYLAYVVEGGLRALKDRSARRRLMRSGIETGKYFLMNPVMGLLEGSAISRSHLEAYLASVHRNGIAVSVIHGTDDVVFPIKKMDHLKNLGWIDFHAVSGDHHEIYAHPEHYLPLVCMICMRQ